MNSFFVPQLGSQIYTMAGMTSQLSLQADEAGTYPGLSAQFSGEGFADMRFDVQALPPDGYAQWIADAKAAGRGRSTATAYAALAKPSIGVSPATYRVGRSGPVRSRSSMEPRRRRPASIRRRRQAAAIAARRDVMFGKLTWSAIPFDQPIPLVTSIVVIVVVLGRARPGSRSRATGPICGASGSPRSITSASASCIACWRW